MGGVSSSTFSELRTPDWFAIVHGGNEIGEHSAIAGWLVRSAKGPDAVLPASNSREISGLRHFAIPHITGPEDDSNVFLPGIKGIKLSQGEAKS